MATYSYTPAAVGSATGWTLRGDTTAAGAAASIVDTGSGLLALWFRSTVSNASWGAAWRSSGNPAEFADGEVYAKLMHNTGDGSRLGRMSLAMRWNSATGSNALGTFYGTRTALGQTAANEMQGLQYGQNNATEIINTALGNSPITSATGVVFHVLTKCSGSTISFKFWKDGTSEPSYTNASEGTITAAGETGFQFLTYSNVYVFYVGVGTSGDSAPRGSSRLLPKLLQLQS